MTREQQTAILQWLADHEVYGGRVETLITTHMGHLRRFADRCSDLKERIRLDLPMDDLFPLPTIPDHLESL